MRCCRIRVPFVRLLDRYTKWRCTYLQAIGERPRSRSAINFSTRTGRVTLASGTGGPTNGRVPPDIVGTSTRGDERSGEPSRRRAETTRLAVAQSKVVLAPDGNSVDNPAPLAFGALHKVRLEQNESYYFRLPTPASAFTIVEDVRLPKRESSNLITDVSILDTDGGVVQPAVGRFNQIDVGYRRTASFSTKQPARFGFKLVNTAQSSDIWFAVLPEGQDQFLPCFGEIVPQPFPSGRDATGTLEQIDATSSASGVPSEPQSHRDRTD